MCGPLDYADAAGTPGTLARPASSALHSLAAQQQITKKPPAPLKVQA